MIRTPENVRIEGIAPLNTGGWAVIGSRESIGAIVAKPTRIVVLVREFKGAGAKAKAIDAAGTNRVVRTADVAKAEA